MMMMTTMSDAHLVQLALAQPPLILRLALLLDAPFRFLSLAG